MTLQLIKINIITLGKCNFLSKCDTPFFSVGSAFTPSVHFLLLIRPLKLVNLVSQYRSGEIFNCRINTNLKARRFSICSDVILPHLVITEMRLNFPIKLIFFVSNYLAPRLHLLRLSIPLALCEETNNILVFSTLLLSYKIEITIKCKTHGHLFMYL